MDEQEDKPQPEQTHQVTFHHQGVYYRAVVGADWLKKRGGGYAGLGKIHEGIPSSAIRWFQSRGRLTEISKDLAMRLIPDPAAIKALQIKPTKWPKRVARGMVRIHVVIPRTHKKEIQRMAEQHNRPSVNRIIRQWIAEGIEKEHLKEGK